MFERACICMHGLVMLSCHAVLFLSHHHPTSILVIRPPKQSIVFVGFQAILQYNTTMSKNLRSNVMLNFLGPAWFLTAALGK